MWVINEAYFTFLAIHWQNHIFLDQGEVFCLVCVDVFRGEELGTQGWLAHPRTSHQNHSENDLLSCHQ